MSNFPKNKLKILYFISSILIYCTLFKAEARQELIESVVATVNEQPIFYSDLQELEQNFQDNNLTFIDEIILMTIDRKKIKKSKKAQLDFMLNEKILDIEFKSLKFKISPEKAHQEMRQFARQGNLSLKAFYKELTKQNISISQYKDFFKKKLERQALIQNQVSSKIEISGQDILTEYIKLYPKRKNSNAFQYTLAQILFVPGFSSGQQGALERAQKVHDQLSKTPENFQALAQKYSEDIHYAQGGFLGILKAEEMMPEIHNVIRSMAIGEISPIINLKKDVRIIKIIDKKLIESLHFKSVKNFIEKKLFEEVFQQHLNHWIQKKRTLASIRINQPFNQ